MLNAPIRRKEVKYTVASAINWDLYKQVKKLQQDTGTSVSDIIKEALVLYLTIRGGEQE